MANLAYQVTNFAYQGDGAFAYQGASGVTSQINLWGRRPDTERILIEEEDELVIAFVREHAHELYDMAMN